MLNFKKYIIEEILKDKTKFALIKLAKIYFFGSANIRCPLIYRIGMAIHKTRFRRVAKFFFLKLERDYGVFISPNAKIGIGLKIPHPSGIVIGNKVRIGNNVTIFQQVTLGGARIGDAQKDLYPEVGDNTVLFAGAKIIGKIKIGKSCVVGANSVVINDVPDHCIVVGIPAKIIDPPKK